MAWLESNWFHLVVLIGNGLSILGAALIVWLMVLLNKHLRRERESWRTIDRLRVARYVALDLRVSALEARSVTAGVTLRNPSPGETR
jgi:hypothetical protein